MIKVNISSIIKLNLGIWIITKQLSNLITTVKACLPNNGDFNIMHACIYQFMALIV